MRMGTKSLLYGAHCLPIHTAMIAIGWRVHHGAWPKDWRIWVTFLCHDLGYWGKRDMDGEDGKLHPMGGARLAARLIAGKVDSRERQGTRAFWYQFTACHSRYYAAIIGVQPSPLAIPDKLATALMPIPLLALLYRLTGEYKGYAQLARDNGYAVPGDAYGYTKWIVNHWREEYLGWKGWHAWFAARANRRKDRSTRPTGRP
jgi:hypothetical protein